MPGTRLQPPPLADRVAQALRRIEASEVAYASITLGDLVRSQARALGDRPAIDIFDRGEAASYAEVDRLSNRYANALRAFGVGKGDRIGLMLPNRIEFPLLWFAAAKLGAVLVAMNVRYTSREVEYVLADTGATFAFVDASARPVFEGMASWPADLRRDRVVVVSDGPDTFGANFAAHVDRADASPPAAQVDPDDLLSIQYTSGTTGFPKGCMLTHDWFSLFSYAAALRDHEPYQRYLSTSPFFYIDGQGILLKSYRQGATVFVAPQLSSSRLMGWLSEYRIDWVQFPELLARQPASPEDASLCLKQIHQFGGWSPESIRAFCERFPTVRNSGYYGMTEIGAATQHVPGFEDVIATGSLGLRAPFRELRIENEDGTPTPIGQVGQLWVRGRSILKGYWNRPEVNAAQFRGEWFATGDLMRRDEHGFHWLVGRTKDMIRRSGENIAAREVEAVMRELPQVAEVAAVPVKDAKRGEEVKLFVELQPGVARDALPVDAILDHARARLAPFKVPRYVAYIDTLPRTSSSNKITKTALTAMADPLVGVYDAETRSWR